MEELMRIFREMVERSDATAAQWAAWHLRMLGEIAEDAVTRVELEHALREDPELLEAAQIALDAVGGVVAEAGLMRRAQIGLPLPAGFWESPVGAETVDARNDGRERTREPAP
jgi:hypothetical protein